MASLCSTLQCAELAECLEVPQNPLVAPKLTVSELPGPHCFLFGMVLLVKQTYFSFPAWVVKRDNRQLIHCCVKPDVNP